MEKIVTSGQVPKDYDSRKLETLLKRIERAINTLVDGQNVVVTSISTSRAVAVSDGYVAVDASASAVTVTLPPASEAINKRIAFQKTDAGANQVIVDGFDTETIDGSQTRTISVQYAVVEIVSDGSTWHRY